MYNKILIPLDGSALAEKALIHAKALAKGCGSAAIDLMFVVQPLDTTVTEPYTDKDREFFSQSDQKAEDLGNRYLSKVAEDLKKDGITAKNIVLLGRPAERILDYVEKNAVDLIVMTTHGRSGLVRWALGSVAERVIKTSTVPVIIVRPKN